MRDAAIELTEAEVAVIALTSALTKAYSALPREHPNEWTEFVSAMHRIQDLVAARPVWRAINADLDPFDLCGGDNPKPMPYEGAPAAPDGDG